MRLLALAFALSVVALGFAQTQTTLSKRYGFDANQEFYPQKTPQEALQSIVKAVQASRIDYLLAQLADPRFVDESVTAYKNSFTQGDENSRLFLAFDRLVAETKAYFLADPSLLGELRRFAKEAEWNVSDAQATGSVKSIEGRKVFMKRYENRWFLENRQQ